MYTFEPGTKTTRPSKRTIEEGKFITRENTLLYIPSAKAPTKAPKATPKYVLAHMLTLNEI